MSCCATPGATASFATMSAAKILWGQVLAVFNIILASVWVATQWTASALGFQAELGAPWFSLFGHPVYRP